MPAQARGVYELKTRQIGRAGGKRVRQLKRQKKLPEQGNRMTGKTAGKYGPIFEQSLYYHIVILPRWDSTLAIVMTHALRLAATRRWRVPGTSAAYILCMASVGLDRIPCQASASPGKSG